jgi:hypothetical protein
MNMRFIPIAALCVLRPALPYPARASKEAGLVYLVKCEFRDAAGSSIADNSYWASSSFLASWASEIPREAGSTCSTSVAVGVSEEKLCSD